MESELEDDKGTSKSESTANDSDCANQDASLSKNPMSNVKKKTRADYQKAYRQRLKEKNTRTQIQKSDEQKRRKAANSKAYRERKKRLRQEGKMQKYSTRESPVFQSQRENPFETVGIYEARTQAPNKIEKNKQQTKIGKTVSPIKQQSEQQEYIKDYDEIVPFISQPMEQNNVNPNQTNIIEVDRHVYIEVEMNEDEFQEVDDNEFREPDPFHQPDQNEDQVQINEQSIQNPFGHACDRFWLKNDLKLVKDDREDILRRNIQKPTTSVKRASLATVVCPNCNTKVKLEDIEAPMVDTRTVIAKVYHFLEREYSALKEKFGDLDLSPFLKFRARTAEATGVSEKTVSKILKEEQELIQVPPQVKRASKRKRYQDSPVMEEREQAEPEIEAVEIKVEPPDDETYTEQAELEIETVEIKVEPPEDETYTEQAGSVSDMLAVHTEPADDHLQNSKQNFLLIDAGKIVMRPENKEEPEEYTFHESTTCREKIVKSQAQRQKEYRQRKKIINQSEIKKRKTNAQYQRKFRENQRNKPLSETLDSILARKKSNAERAKRYRENKKQAKQNETLDSNLARSKQNFLLIDAGKIVMRPENKEEPEEYTFHERKNNAERAKRYREKKKRKQQSESLDSILARKKKNAERIKMYRDKLKSKKEQAEVESLQSSKEESLPIESNEETEELTFSPCQKNRILSSVNNEAQQVRGHSFITPQTQGKTSTTEYSTNIAHNDVELGKKSDKEVGTTKEINIKIEEIEFTEGFT